MKKLISLLLAAVLCLSFAACSPHSSSRPSGEETTTFAPSGDETTSPDHSGDQTTSPDHSGDQTTSPDHSGDETKDSSGDETTAPDSSEGNNVIAEKPDDFFAEDKEDYVSNSIIQSGKDQSSNDDNVNARVVNLRTNTYLTEKTIGMNKKDTPDLNTTIKGYEYELEDCFVSGYIGNDLFIIQDFGSLGWNKKGIGHRDGTYIWNFGEDEGFFSISSMSENMIIVGNPTDENVESLWDDTSSYIFGYLVYDEETKTLTPLYENDNLRFYTATYFIDGYAIVSVEIDGEISSTQRVST